VKISGQGLFAFQPSCSKITMIPSTENLLLSHQCTRFETVFLSMQMQGFCRARVSLGAGI
jgi:hypothetical protein